ncbi:MAG: hypothetical protein F6J86_26875 [Symploca sp. SIO1B1]|nr:hypothetical protein [Symploca sp. SIO1B1]
MKFTPERLVGTIVYRLWFYITRRGLSVLGTGICGLGFLMIILATSFGIDAEYQGLYTAKQATKRTCKSFFIGFGAAVTASHALGLYNDQEKIDKTK